MKKVLLVLLTLILVAACNNPEWEELENVMRFNVTAGAGAENVSGAKVEAFDRRGNKIADSISDSNGHVVLEIPKVYVGYEELVDIVVTKKGYGSTRVQGLALGEEHYLRDVAIFKQVYNFVSDEELEEKGIKRADIDAPKFEDIILYGKDGKKFKVENGDRVDLDYIEKIDLELESLYGINSSGHKWQGIRAEINNMAHRNSAAMNTEATSFDAGDDEFEYTGEIVLGRTLFAGENFIELVAQDTRGNQVIKRLYIYNGEADVAKNLDTTSVVIRDYAFTFRPHNQGYYFLPFKSVSSTVSEGKADVSAFRRLTLSFATFDKATGEEVAIRGYNVYYRSEEEWKLLETASYSESKLGSKYSWLSTEKNNAQNYSHFKHVNYDSFFEVGKFYDFKVEVFDDNRDILGVSNVVSARPLSEFSIKANGDFDVHGSEAKVVPTNNAELKFDLLFLDELEVLYNQLTEEEKALIAKRYATLGFEMRSVAGGVRNSMIYPQTGVGVPFVMKYEEDGSKNVYGVFGFDKDANYYGTPMPGGDNYTSLYTLDTRILNIDANNTVTLNVSFFSQFMQQYIPEMGASFNDVLKYYNGIELVENFLRDEVVYEWDIVGFPLMDGGSNNYSGAKYIEKYNVVPVELPYDLDQDGKLDVVLSNGMSEVRINNRTATPDGAYTIMTKGL